MSVRNDGDQAQRFSLDTALRDASGAVVGRATVTEGTVGAASESTATLRYVVSHPRQWTAETPSFTTFRSR